MTVFPSLNSIFPWNHKTPSSFQVDIDKLILKCEWKSTWDTKEVLKEQNWRIHPLILRFNYKAQQWRLCVYVCVCVFAQALSCVQLCDPWTVACKSLLSLEFSRQDS